MLGLCHVARPGTTWGPLAAQEKRDLRVMETDYSHYAIVHELQKKEQETSTALQLFSGCREQGRAPMAPRGGIQAPVRGRGWAPHCRPGPPMSAPNVLAPREFILE